VPCQGRLSISRSRVPNLDGCVIAAAGNFLSIGTPRHRVYTVFVRSQYTNQQKPGGKTWGKNLLARVSGHRRLANSRLRVPNLDGVVPTTAGNLFSIRTPRHRVDTEIVRSQDTNQQKQRWKHLGKRNLRKKKRTNSRSAATRKHTFLSLVHFYIFTIYLSKKIRFRVSCLMDTHKGTYILCYFFVAY